MFRKLLVAYDGSEGANKALQAGIDLAKVLGHEVEGIIDYTRRHGLDLLLVGFHGHSAIADRIFGSTSRSLMLNAPCSVMLVK